MKDKKHIKSFNESTENLNSELSKDTSSSISDVSDSFTLEDMKMAFQAGRGYQEHLEMQKAKYFDPDEMHKIDYKTYSFSEWVKRYINDKK